MIWAKIGAVLMFLAVALGAFAAHALKAKLSPEMLAIFETGVRYQVYHALALLFLAWLAQTHPSSLVRFAGICFAAGVFIFSGSLYALALSGVKIWGAVTPIGGLAFLVGWALVVFSL